MLSPGELTLGHQEIKNECTSCHKPLHGIESKRCITCHKLEEIGMDTTGGDSAGNKYVLFHDKLSDQQCTLCHSDHKGIDPSLSLARFDHNLLEENIINNCIDCHNKPVDRMHEQLTGSCSPCHNTNTWEFSGKFDHALITGANKTNCISCHKNPLDAFHQSLKENCDKCHGTDKWVPSTFDHADYFILDEDHNVKCATCHTNNNLKVYTCYGCHEHSEAKIREEHIEHGIYKFNDCASCHKSADEHDIKGFDRNERRNSEDAKKVRDYLNSREEKDEH